MPNWLKTDTSLSPFFLPDELETEENNFRIELFAGLAEFLRMVVITQQSPKWKTTLPYIPMTTRELKIIMQETEARDEGRVLQMLAEEGSVAAGIISMLQLTRSIVKEAMKVLSDSREDQQNLMDILGAARYKVLHLGKLYYTVCPRPRCYNRDTFLHMLKCYDLQGEVQKGPEAVPFLVDMARKTHRPKRKKVIPYPEIITKETKKRDWEEMVTEMEREFPQTEQSTAENRLESQPELSL